MIRLLYRSGWVVLVIFFDICYYYFVQYLIEGKGETTGVSFRFEAIFFLFLISLFSILCVTFAKRALTSIYVDRLMSKYILVLFTSFVIFLFVVVGFQYGIEIFLGQNRPFSYYLNNMILLGFLHLIIGNTAAGVSYFRESAKLQSQIIERDKKQAEIELQALKQQMSPHFLFNNLNTLNSLISLDPNVAKEFTQHLSSIYRYTTQVWQEELVLLTKELEFSKSYFRLMQLRFGNIYIISHSANDINEGQWWTIPMAMQIVLENVIIHNTASKDQPLNVSITIVDDYLIISNPLRPKKNEISDGLGIALQNLNEQAKLVTGRAIVTDKLNETFTTKIPLMKNVDYENTHN